MFFLIFLFAGASVVLEQNRQLSKNLIQDKSFLLDSLPSFDSDLNFQSPFLEPLFGNPFLSLLKDSNMDSNSPDSQNRGRKCSISDIIDVINEDKSFLQNTLIKDDGYDSVSANDFSSNESFSSDDIYLPCKSNSNFSTDKPIKEQSLPVKENIFSRTTTNMSDKDPAVVIIITDKNQEQVRYSTTKEKLEEFLQKESSHQTPLGTQTESVKPTVETEPHIVDSNEMKRRGRKRIYYAVNESERDDSRRIRNNHACRKFRKGKNEKMKSLFESESKLLQRNLNLKEQVIALERQLSYIKEKLNNPK